MKITIQNNDLKDWSGTVLVIGIFEEKIQSQIEALNGISQPELLIKHLEAKDFSGKNGEKLVIQLLGEPIKKLIFVGLGNSENLLLNNLREGASLAAKESINSNGAMGIIFPWDKFNSKIAAKAVAESIRLSFFKDQRFQSDPKPAIHPREINLIGIHEDIQDTLKQVNSICSGVELCLLYTSPSPRDVEESRMPSSA